MATFAHKFVSIASHRLGGWATLLLGFICATVFGIFVVVSLPVYIFRFVVILSANYFRPDLGEILNAQSAALVNDLFQNPSPRSNIIVTVIMRGELTLEETRELVRRNWLKNFDKKSGELIYRKFQQYPVRWMGFTFYKNAFDKFNIDEHVFNHTSLSGDSPHVSEDELNGLVEELLNAPHHLERSPWELHVVPKYKNLKISAEGDMSVLLFKVHHSLADGFSILSALVEGLFEYPLSDVKMPVPRLLHRTFSEKIVYLMGLPLTALYELSYVMSNIFRPSPWKVPDREKEWYQVCAKSDMIPVKVIKDIKNELGVSFTSVLLSAISAGIYRSLQDTEGGGPVAGNECKSMYCLSVLPVPGHTRRLTNHTTGASFDIPCVKFSSSVERLMNCYRMLEDTKKTVLPYLVRYYMTIVGCHFYPVCNALFKNRMFSTGLSNFPSAPMHIQHKHKRGIVVDFATGLLDGVAGVGIMVLSYNQHIRVVVAAERALFSKEDANKFVDYVGAEIRHLHAKAKGN